MPSFPDHDVQAPQRVHTATPGAPEELLRRVKAEGMRRRTRRRRRNTVFVAFGLALAAVPAVALLPGGDDGNEDVTVAAEAERQTSTTDTPETTARRRTTTTVVATETTIGQPVIVAPSTIVLEDGEVGLIPPTSIVRPPAVPPGQRPSPTTAPPTTAPAPACRDSRDSACGPFRWDPDPGPNQALTASFVNPPAFVTIGETVAFRVNWSDPDAPLTFDNFSAEGTGLGQACAQEPRFGPWTPPERVAGSGVLEYSHTFTQTGTFRIVVSVGTADCNSPYGNETTTETVVTVE